MIRSALILAGGGIRVAWQTGVVMALDEAGIDFAHGDGTSGGIFTLGMLLSGQTPDEMAERWRSVNVIRFLSPLPFWQYLRSPTNWPAIGGSSGIRHSILPKLGIDLARINRATSMTGSFNVADFHTKRCVAIPHDELDEDLLIAGISLAGVMPAIRRRGRVWTDAVWIKDANLTEAVRRGCTELWLAWCIGNTPGWRHGALEQYVHMIEMSATGGLTSELQWIADLNAVRAQDNSDQDATEKVVLHVVKPRLPIPLDLEFVLGRIDAETLIAMGYRDACAYLADMTPDGVPIDDELSRTAVTATPARALGGRMTFRARGCLAPGGYAECTLVVEVDSLEDLATYGRATGVGGFRHPHAGYRPFRTTIVELVGWDTARFLSATATLTLEGVEHRLHIRIPMPSGNWSAAREQHWTLTHAGGTPVATGTGKMSVLQTIRSVTSFEPTGAHTLADRVRAILHLRRIVRYGGRRPASSDAPTASG
jgi:predicted acylesterase/phospholipase RssA